MSGASIHVGEGGKSLSERDLRKTDEALKQVSGVYSLNEILMRPRA